jgi:hypothetical protein
MWQFGFPVLRSPAICGTEGGWCGWFHSNECFHGSRYQERHLEQGGFPIPSLPAGRFVGESSGTFGKKVLREIKTTNFFALV